jgi:hypothetical protein
MLIRQMKRKSKFLSATTPARKIGAPGPRLRRARRFAAGKNSATALGMTVFRLW